MTDISLALGGGGIKGIAHIGVIQRLLREGYKIRAVAGTSAGGLVGAVFAAGCDLVEVVNALHTANRNALFARATGDGPSLLGLAGVAQLFLDMMGDRRFDELDIPFACTAVDLKTAQEVILSQGRVLDALLATIAVPGIFPPKLMGDAELVDGGIADPVPVALARWLAPRLPVVAVSLSPVPEGWRHLPTSAKGLIPSSVPIPAPLLSQMSRLRIAQAFGVFSRSMDITQLMLGELRLQIEQPDAIIRPDVHEFSILEDVDPNILLERGEQAAEEALPAIKDTLGWQNNVRRRMRRVHPPGAFLPASAEGKTEKDSDATP